MIDKIDSDPAHQERMSLNPDTTDTVVSTSSPPTKAAPTFFERLGYLTRTLPLLGWRNVLYVAFYRATLKSGLRRWSFPSGTPWCDIFFEPQSSEPTELPDSWWRPLLAEVGALHRGRVLYYGRHEKHVGSPPNWFANPFNGTGAGNPQRHWTALSDFDSGQGDIKNIWEASRFGWAPLFARAWRITGERQHLEFLNAWLADWTERNPSNLGPNWKCGQETALRLLHVMLTGWLLDSLEQPREATIRFAYEHGRRIAGNIRYALAQDNNHGTSEAAGLFLAGNWLLRVSASPQHRATGEKWAQMGRRLLEERALKLITPDGGFSQYSTTYHRLMLDTYSLVEHFRQAWKLPSFADEVLSRLRAATMWLYHLTDPQSGDAPNLGTNDGSFVFRLSSCGYRDFRPSVQWAAWLFHGQRFYEPGPYDETLFWLGHPLDRPAKPPERPPKSFPEFGLVLMDTGRTRGFVRTTKNRFRPAHADALHLDLWVDGRNLLRDSGSYSYNDDDTCYRFLSGTPSHNCVTFEDRDQMPRIGKFLFGCWTNVEENQPLHRGEEGLQWAGSYRDDRGCLHIREITATESRWCITDRIAGFDDSAPLRWRLMPGDWVLTPTGTRSSMAEIRIHATTESPRMALVEEWESRHYWERSRIPVLTVTVEREAVLTTEILIEEKAANDEATRASPLDSK